MQVQVESPDQADVIGLIAELDAYQASLYPAEACYALGLAALLQPEVRFVVARDAQRTALGCGALVLGPQWGELKRMYVRPGCRQQGIAHQVLALLQQQAVQAGCHELRLETGPYQPEALAFYRRQGFASCGPFGSYPDHPLSVFMAKRLAGPDNAG